MDFKEAIGAVIAGVVLLIPAIKWLIKDWSNKATELEKLKASNTSRSLTRLEDDVKGFRSSIDSLQVQLRDLNAALLLNRSDIAILKERLEDAKKHIEEYSSSKNEQVKSMIKTEITELTKNLMIIRDKKNGR